MFLKNLTIRVADSKYTYSCTYGNYSFGSDLCQIYACQTLKTSSFFKNIDLNLVSQVFDDKVYLE